MREGEKRNVALYESRALLILCAGVCVKIVILTDYVFISGEHFDGGDGALVTTTAVLRHVRSLRRNEILCTLRCVAYVRGWEGAHDYCFLISIQCASAAPWP